jgi:hypothetical protein
MSLQPHFNEYKLSFQNQDILLITNFYNEIESQKAINIIHTLDHNQNEVNYSNHFVKKKGVMYNLKLATIILALLTNYISVISYYPQIWRLENVNPNLTWNYIENGYHIKSSMNTIPTLEQKYSVIIFLSDVNSEIIFPEYHLKFKPKLGQLLVFNKNLIFELISNNDFYFIETEINYTLL